MSQVIERPAPPRLPTWPVYAVAAATVPLTWVSSTLVFALAALGLVLSDGGTSAGLESEIDRVLRDELLAPGKLPGLVLSIVGNAIVFFTLPLYIASRGGDRAVTHARLALRPARFVDMLIGTVGLLSLTTFLDAVVSLFSLSDYGHLAELRDLIASAPEKLRLSLALVVGVGAGVPEEMFFRGFVLQRLAASQGRTAALVASSLLFGVFHFDWVHTPLALVMGLFLGFLTLRTRSIYPAIVAHVVNNAFFTLLVDYEAPEAASWALLPLGLIGTVGALVVISLIHKKDTPEALSW